MPTIAAFAYRHSRGLPYVYPDNDLSYAGNFLSMLFKMTELKYRPDPVLEHALDVLFTLHADHEQNCSTTAARVVGSSLADPYSVVAAAAAALSGPRHGGANEEVVRMLHEIGSVSNVPALIKAVKAGDRRLMGFGHRVYKNYDPRAKIIKEVAHQVFEVTGKSPLIDIALELEKIALDDEYFVQAPAVSQRRLLFGHHLRSHGLPDGDVPRAVRHPADGRVDGPVGRAGARRGAEDLAAEAALHGPRRAAVRAARLSP